MSENQTGVEEAAAEPVIPAEPTGVVSVPPTDDGDKPPVEQPTEQEIKEAALIQSRDDLAERARQSDKRADQSDETARMALEAAKRAEEYNAYLQGQQQRPVDRFEGRDPDEVVTIAELKQIENENKQRIETAQFKTKEEQRQNNLTESLDRAREKHSNFDEVLAKAQKIFNQQELGAIGMMKDPGERLYKMVIAENPEMKAQEKADIVKETIDTVNANLNTPGTLSGAGGSDTVLDQAKKFGQMSNEDFEAEIAAVKRK
jgi:hypothetical protein